MNQQEQHLADELEQLIQAAQAGQSVPDSQVPQDEAALAAQLVDLSQQTEAAPAFVANLRARLRRRANQIQIKKTSQKKASFWQELSRMLAGDNTMKRGLALGAIILLIVFVGAAVFSSGLFDTGTQVAEVTPMPIATIPGEEEAAVAEELPLNPETSPESSEEVVVAPEGEIESETAVAVLPPSELQPLPRFEAQIPGGFGGGGDGTDAAGNPVAAEMPVIDGEFDLKLMDPFSGTLFTLNTLLPADTTTGQVLQRQAEATIDAASARQIADQYGFTGPLYVETYPSDVPTEGPSVPPTTYVAFDGARTLRIDPWSINYNNETAAANVDYENLQPHPDEGAIATAFLQERGQLDFPYVMEERESYDVFFYRDINGRHANEPEIVVSVNNEGEVMFVFDSTTTGWDDLGVYPLVSAEQAWQKVLGGVYENSIQYWMMPADLGEAMPIEDPAFIEEYQYWPRTYAVGSEVHFYEWPQVYRTVDTGAPLLKMRQYTLAGDEATLNAIAEARDQQIHLWGTLNADNSITLAGWEALDTYEPVFQQGVVRREGDQLVFFGNEGDNYILPDAPADIADDLEVNVFGYGVRDMGLAYPLLDWESIDKYIEYPEPGIEEPLPPDVGLVDSSMPTEPFAPLRYGEVVIDSVSLQYAVTYLWPEVPEGEELLGRQSPTVVMQPAWAFAGKANNGDTITLFVQAVDEAYLQQP